MTTSTRKVLQMEFPRQGFPAVIRNDRVGINDERKTNGCGLALYRASTGSTVRCSDLQALPKAHKAFTHWQPRHLRATGRQ